MNLASLLFNRPEPKKQQKDVPKNTIIIDTRSNNFLYRNSIGHCTYDNFIEAYNKLSPYSDITIEITTGGGDVFNALMIANVLYNHRGKTTAKISKYCMSGGMVVALTCDQIFINETACIGYIEPEYGYLGIPLNDIYIYLDKYINKNNINNNTNNDNLVNNIINTHAGLTYEKLNKIKEIYGIKIRRLFSRNRTEEQINKLMNFFYYNSDQDIKDTSIPIFNVDIPIEFGFKFYNNYNKNLDNIQKMDKLKNMLNIQNKNSVEKIKDVEKLKDIDFVCWEESNKDIISDSDDNNNYDNNDYNDTELDEILEKK